jgi:hypothetical protein
MHWQSSRLSMSLENRSRETGSRYCLSRAAWERSRIAGNNAPCLGLRDVPARLQKLPTIESVDLFERGKLDCLEAPPRARLLSDRQAAAFMRKASVLCMVLCSLGATGAPAKDVGKLQFGRTVSCAEAVKYRDAVLIREYDAIVARYADGTADRQQRVRDMLDIELARLDIRWAETNHIVRKKIAAQGVGLALALAGVATGKWAASRVAPGDQAAVQLLTDRATTALSAVTSQSWTGQVSVSDIALLPVSSIVTVALPSASVHLAILSIGLGVVDGIENLVDLTLEKAAYEGSADVLKAALRNLAKKSVTGQLERLNSVKNEIDRVCG